MTLTGDILIILIREDHLHLYGHVAHYISKLSIREGGKEEGQGWRMAGKEGEKPVWQDRRLSLPTYIHIHYKQREQYTVLKII